MNTILASELIQKQQTRLAEDIIRRYTLRQDKGTPLFDPSAHQKSVRDAGYHLIYLAEALALNDAALFSEYILWARDLFEGLHFDPQMLTDTMACTLESLGETLPPEAFQSVEQYFHQANQTLQHTLPGIESYIEVENPQATLVRKFMRLLLKGDQRSASTLILEAHLQKNVSIHDLYLFVFQVSQREIGRLWQMNQISVAEEHYCTAATQLIMGQLYPYLFKGNSTDKRMIVSCAQGELHEVGARMVADFFEMDGWDSYFLGANTPTDAIFEMVSEIHPQVLALSATMAFHVRELSGLIQQVKALPNPPKILVGGYPFNLSVDLWQKIGADGYAADAEQAVCVARQWDFRN